MKWLSKDRLISAGISIVLAFEILMLTDCLVVWFGAEMKPILAAGYFAGLFLGICLMNRFFRKQIMVLSAAIPVFLAAAGIVCWLGWYSFSSRANYEAVDNGKVQMYGGRRVMLIVPHQDDELNVLGGVLEEYVRYGSEIYGVFSTNGDYETPAQVRYQEAISVFESLGVSEEHVIFLGYGDGWKEGGPHIYNAEPERIMESHAGKTETYGPQQHASYRTGRAYTLQNLTEDLQDVILEYRPDVIFCSDYDDHVDHKALTLLFDRVMGQILKENLEYQPIVYKAYAYNTAWTSEADYYAPNVLSTKNPFADPLNQKPAVYRWEDRVRFPVDGGGMSRSLVGSESFEHLSLHKSQYAMLMAASVINGDRVAWQRRTDSLVLHGDVTASSGDAGLLNDFMLVDNNDLINGDHKPYDGVWIPESGDKDQSVTVTLAQTENLASIVLYDHPSGEHNVLNAVISFEDGTQLETGPLDPGGAATAIVVNKADVGCFSVTLTDTEGEKAGLSEIEAFAKLPETEGRFIKLMDQEGNFLYDYLLPENGQAELSVYRYGDLPEVTAESYAVGTSWGQGTAALEDGVIRVECSEGECFVLNVTCSESGVSDNIFIRNPGKMERLWVEFWQKAEEMLFIRYKWAGQRLLIFTLPDKISYVLRHLG